MSELSDQLSEICRTIALLSTPEGYVEVRIPHMKDGRGIRSGYYNDLKKLCGDVLAIDRNAEAIYILLNEVKKGVESRREPNKLHILKNKEQTTSDSDISHRRWVLIDLDPERPAGTSSSNEQHDAALKKAKQIRDWLITQGFPGMIYADSGNGGHLLIAIDMPNDEQANVLIKEFLVTLDYLFPCADGVKVDLTTYNAARVSKLYGTWACKGYDSDQYPWRIARMLEVPERIEPASTELLKKVIDKVPKAQETCETDYTGIKTLDAKSFLKKHGIAVYKEMQYHGGTMYLLEECPFNKQHQQGDAKVIQFPNGAISFSCFHNSCAEHKWRDFRAHYEPEFKEGHSKQKPTPKKDHKERKVGELPLVDTCPPEIIEKALKELKYGNPFAFFKRTFNKAHIGDIDMIRIQMICRGAQAVRNCAGLHMLIVAESQEGKTHGAMTFAGQNPEEMVLIGSQSPKAMFHLAHDKQLHSGTWVVLDDKKDFQDDFEEHLKTYISSWPDGSYHNTVKQGGGSLKLFLPPRLSFCITSKDAHFNDEMLNRFFIVPADSSQLQDEMIGGMQRMKAVRGEDRRPQDEDLLVCKAMIKELIQIDDFGRVQTTKVEIPYANLIEWTLGSKRNLQEEFLDTIKAIAIWFKHQRPRKEDGTVIATLDDFRMALAIWNKYGRAQQYHRKDDEVLMGEVLLEEAEKNRRENGDFIVTRRQWYKKLVGHPFDKRFADLSDDNFSLKVNGRRNKEGQYNGGLRQKMGGFISEPYTKRDASGQTIETGTQYRIIDPAAIHRYINKDNIASITNEEVAQALINRADPQVAKFCLSDPQLEDTLETLIRIVTDPTTSVATILHVEKLTKSIVSKKMAEQKIELTITKNNNISENDPASDTHVYDEEIEKLEAYLVSE